MALSLLVLVGAAIGRPSLAQFVDVFDDPDVTGWTFRTGDGQAKMDLRPGSGYASIIVDATQDKHNVWWALVKREVSSSLDLIRLREPGFELRIEARIRTSHAPRRVNLHLNTQRTVDFHTHLMEYDLPDTSSWHVISMTTEGFEAGPGDQVNAQLALMDWGRGTYRVDIDYFRVDVVETESVLPGAGEPLPYHPPVPSPSVFAFHPGAEEGAMVDRENPDLSLNGWYEMDASDSSRVLTVDGSRYVILRWDLSDLAGREASGPGLLELRIHSVQRAPLRMEELGQVRVVEILDGDRDWQSESVTWNSWTGGCPLSQVVNTQMIIDIDPAETEGGTAFATINRPVMQRLLDGRTLGLMLRPLGPVSASIHPPGDKGPLLHFNLLSGNTEPGQ